MAHRGVAVLGILASLTGAVGCGGRSANDSGEHGSGSAASAASGGAGSGGHVAAGGVSGTSTPVEVSGGGGSTGGYSALTGGSTSLSTGGTRSVGGSVATGGKSSTGGAFATGGKSAAGGKSGVGGVVPTGGKSNAGGTLSTGGKSAATGGGGNSSTGGVAASGGTSASSGIGGSTIDGGDPLIEFCQGDESKILYQGTQEVVAPASSYQSALFMNCCMAWGVNLHSKDALGFDVDVETAWSVGDSISPGVFTVGTSMQPMRAFVHRSNDASSPPYGATAEGTAELFTAFSYQDPFDLGLCLSLYKTETTLWKTLVYVPRVRIASYASRTRFQIFLLSDATITPSQASARDLDSLELAPSPVLDLDRIAYVSSSVDEIGFNPGQKIGETLRTKLDGLGMAVPFVLVADSARLSLGSFVSLLSSAIYPGPNIMIEDIGADSMTIQIVGSGPDPLKDSRALTVLGETGKLI